MFVAGKPSQPSLMFVGKASSLPRSEEPLTCSTLELMSYNYSGVNLLTFFCKIDHFVNISNIYAIAMKRSSLHNRISKFPPKKFY